MPNTTAIALHQQYLFDLPQEIRLAVTAVIILLGVLFMSKFHRIYRWIRQRGLKISTPA